MPEPASPPLAYHFTGLSAAPCLPQDHAFPPSNEGGGGAYGRGNEGAAGSKGQEAGGREEGDKSGSEGGSKEEGEDSDKGGSEGRASDSAAAHDSGSKKGESEGGEQSAVEGQGRGPKDGNGADDGDGKSSGGSQAVEGGDDGGGTIALVCGPPPMVGAAISECLAEVVVALRLPWCSLPQLGSGAGSREWCRTQPAHLQLPHLPFLPAHRLRRPACRRCGSWGSMRTTSLCSEESGSRRGAWPPPNGLHMVQE